MSVNEPKELRPFIVFGARPPLGGHVGIVRDFRAMPVDVNDALPPRAPEVQTPAPKLQVSSVTAPVVESETGETEPVTPSLENPVPATGLPLSLQRPPLTPGANGLPAPGSTVAPPALPE